MGPLETELDRLGHALQGAFGRSSAELAPVLRPYVSRNTAYHYAGFAPAVRKHYRQRSGHEPGHRKHAELSQPRETGPRQRAEAATDLALGETLGDPMHERHVEARQLAQPEVAAAIFNMGMFKRPKSSRRA